MKESIQNTDLVIIGAGPGGYTSAFRAADLGLKVILIDKNINLGGVCLNEGCIPSKSLLHLSKIINDTKNASNHGLIFSKPKLDINKIQDWKNNIISNLNKGISKLAHIRNINIINGHASFKSAEKLEITDFQNKKISITFKNCIIATGSKPQVLKHLNKQHPSIINSKDALNFKNIPKRLLIIGGGYIGLELGTVFSSFGSKVTIAEFLPNLLSMADEDLVKPLEESLNNKFENIYLSTEVTSVIPQNNDSVVVSFKQENKEFKATCEVRLKN